MTSTTSTTTTIEIFSTEDRLAQRAEEGLGAPAVDRSDLASWISYWTAFDGGEKFTSEAEVRAYFTPEAMVDALGADAAITDSYELEEWADAVWEHGWHVDLSSYPLEEQIAIRLSRGDSAEAVAADFGGCTAEGDTVILPGGWWGSCAEDGVVVDLGACDSASDAAAEFVAGGEWGDRDRSARIRVDVWRRGVTGDGEGRVDEETIVAEIPAIEPPCSAGEAHEWTDGRITGSGGGVKYTDTCTRCGVRRSVDTWADDGYGGVAESTAYLPAEDDGDDY